MAELQARGQRFHVQRLGRWDEDATTRRPLVVFLHGLVMDNLSSWYFTAANPVAQIADVLLYDLRGHGRSERPERGYTVADMVADLDAVLDAAGVTRPVHLVGNSFGGLLGLAYAIAHPERTAGLVLVDAHLSDEGWGGEMAATLGLEGEEADRKIAEAFQSWLGRHSERKRNRLAHNARELVYGTSLVADLQASPAFEESALRGIACPTLALYGEDSDVLDRGRRLAGLLGRCELRILPGCTHSVIWEATETVRDAIVDWVRGRAS